MTPEERAAFDASLSDDLIKLIAQNIDVTDFRADPAFAARWRTFGGESPNV